MRLRLELQTLHAALNERHEVRRLSIVVLLSEQLFENAHLRLKCSKLANLILGSNVGQALPDDSHCGNDRWGAADGRSWIVRQCLTYLAELRY
jgi:hypothetical protein